MSTLAILPLYPDEPLTNYKNLPPLIAHASTYASYGTMADTQLPLQPVQDGAAVISNKRGIYKMTEFNAYGLVMNKQIVSSEELVNGHTASTLRLELLAQNLVLFFLTARKFLEKINAGGALYFRLKMSNTRARRVLFGNYQATVLEDYLRMDRTLSLSDLQTDLHPLFGTLLHETAWSLGLQLPPAEVDKLMRRLLNEVEE